MDAKEPDKKIERILITTTSQFSAWLRNNLEGKRRRQLILIAANELPKVVIGDLHTRLSNEQNEVVFSLESNWLSEEKGQKLYLDGNTQFIEIKALQNTKTTLLLSVHIPVSNSVLEDFVSNLVIDSMNTFPPQKSQDSTSVTDTRKNAEESLSAILPPNISLTKDEETAISYWRKDCTAEEIGEMLGKHPGTISNMITRLRKRLGEKVVPYHG